MTFRFSTKLNHNANHTLPRTLLSTALIMSPRPILKPARPDAIRQPVYSQPFRQPAHHEQQPLTVHFPPSPALTRTFLVHSASTYDRSPIIVSPNDCALPERGCPGRTYFDELLPSSPTSRKQCMPTKGYHPRAFSSKSSLSPSPSPASFGSSYDSVPPLVPDFSSESEESDGVSSLPAPSSITYGPHGLPTPPSPYRTLSNSLGISMHTLGYAACDQDAALAFLPYSPASPAPLSYHYEDKEYSLHNEKPRRRRDRKHEGTVDPDRIPSSEAQLTQFAHAFSSLSISTTSSPVGSPPRSPSTPRKKSSSKSHSPSCSPGFSNFPDDSCLGGF